MNRKRLSPDDPVLRAAIRHAEVMIGGNDMPAMRAGSYSEGELWLRCPFCGDSETHVKKAHFSVNTAGVYHCFRCSKSGRLPMAQLVNLYAKADVLGVALRGDMDQDPHEFEDLFERVLPGPGTSRYSALDRFQHNKSDVFLSRNPNGELIGLALAGRGLQRRIIGHRGFGFKGEELTSDPENPIRLVEGPYDVLTDRDVCVYGLISVRHMRQLKGHCVILCPDGDVWMDEAKQKSILRCLQDNHLGASVVYVERLEDDKDPDEVPYNQRWHLTVSEVLARYP